MSQYLEVILLCSYPFLTPAVRLGFYGQAVGRFFIILLTICRLKITYLCFALNRNYYGGGGAKRVKRGLNDGVESGPQGSWAPKWTTSANPGGMTVPAENECILPNNIPIIIIFYNLYYNFLMIGWDASSGVVLNFWISDIFISKIRLMLMKKIGMLGFLQNIITLTFCLFLMEL